MAGFLSRLFGGGAASPQTNVAKPVEYNGYMIYPEPMRDGSKWRIAARIERVVDGDVRSHHLIRADTLADEQEARDASAAKARTMIDQQGDGIFG
ncbi:HlyU family transcriptional regulator [Jannaschia donghaensis]|uniref:Transcriptional activator HlyU n=1 Tax=Jannaschia donghaensis TaxID=420998 RepID=A0A0M6YJ98_9RHOB|nr:HlyU family transcriptional regulator [Jannaschia donghaensis]CTQ49994.1 hypothetical protein JDO7802_02011 [Jannaschia donghaensis]